MGAMLAPTPRSRRLGPDQLRLEPPTALPALPSDPLPTSSTPVDPSPRPSYLNRAMTARGGSKTVAPQLAHARFTFR